MAHACGIYFCTTIVDTHRNTSYCEFGSVHSQKGLTRRHFRRQVTQISGGSDAFDQLPIDRALTHEYLGVSPIPCEVTSVPWTEDGLTPKEPGEQTEKGVMILS